MAKLLGYLIKSACLCVALCLFNGCENGGGNDYDFGTNNPDLAVALGDSITALEGGNSTTYPAILSVMTGKTVLNEGHGGASSADGADKIGSVLNGNKPGYVLILYGANDIICATGNDHLIANLRAMVIAAKNNKTVPIVATLTPMYWDHDIFQGGIVVINSRIRQMAAEEGCPLADLESAFGSDTSLFKGDGLHPNDAGLQVIAQTFASQM